jgi:predicted house-cleaning noncanonical NTP pyrophosphatase (MazG superfamily)
MLEINFCGIDDAEVQDKFYEMIENDYVGSEFTVMTEEEREKAVRDYIKESAWAFNTNFIIDHSNIEYNNRIEKSLKKMQEELCEDANEIILALINDFDEFVEDAVNSDGYGHFLSQYDGEESEIEINGTLYFIYRNN